MHDISNEKYVYQINLFPSCHRTCKPDTLSNLHSSSVEDNSQVITLQMYNMDNKDGLNKANLFKYRTSWCTFSSTDIGGMGIKGHQKNANPSKKWNLDKFI